MIQDSKLLSIKFSLNGLNSRVPAIIDTSEIDREATEEARDRIRKKYEMLRRGRHLK